MKKIALILCAGLMVGCSCLGQLPPQYSYVDESCNSVLIDYRDMVVVRDCNGFNVIQEPPPGTVISGTTGVIISAVDESGNESSVTVEVRLLDTIPPDIQLNPDWAYTWGEVGDMWWTVVKHTQKSFIEGKQLIAQWDTLNLADRFTVMNFTIPIPDSLTHDVFWNYLLTKPNN